MGAARPVSRAAQPRSGWFHRHRNPVSREAGHAVDHLSPGDRGANQGAGHQARIPALEAGAPSSAFSFSRLPIRARQGHYWREPGVQRHPHRKAPVRPGRAGGQYLGHAGGEPARHRAAQLHHWLASVVPVRRCRSRQPRSGRGGTPVADRKQFAECRPVSAGTASATPGTDFRDTASAHPPHREGGGRGLAGQPPAVAGQGCPLLDAGALPFRLGRHAQDAGLSDGALRSRPASTDRNRGAGELPAPAPAARTGRGVPAGIGSHSANRHHPLTILHQSAATRGSAGAPSRCR